MTQKHNTLLLGLCSALVMGGTLSLLLTTPAVAEEKAKAEETAGNFARGAKLWANRCSNCHNMRDPKDLTDSEWKSTLTHMRIRAGISGQDARDILEFLQNSN
jgi:mono/diheme cytochrome c family protein